MLASGEILGLSGDFQNTLCHTSVAISIPSTLLFRAIGRAPLWCTVAPNGTIILALRSRTAQGWVHSMTAGGHHLFPYHETAQHRGASPMVIIDSQVHAY